MQPKERIDKDLRIFEENIEPVEKLDLTQKEKSSPPHGNCFMNRDTTIQPSMRSLPNPVHPRALFITILKGKMPCLDLSLSFLMKNIPNWKLSWCSSILVMNS